MTDQEIILCDVDGVCACFDEEIIRQIRPHLTTEEIQTLLLENNDWDVFRIFSTEEKQTCFDLLSKREFWDQMKPFPAAQHTIEKLRKQNFHIRFLTSPWKGCDTWIDARTKWLEKHFDTPFEDVTISREKYNVHGEMFIDDKREHLEKWVAYWSKITKKDYKKRAFLCETSWNKKDDWFPRITTEGNKWRMIHK